MLRFAVIAMALMASPAFALTTIICTDAPYELELEVDVLKSNPPQTTWSLRKDGKEAGKGSVEKAFEGVDGFLHTWIWTFQGEQFVAGIALEGGLQASPAPGKYSAKADLFVKAGNVVFDGSTVGCSVVVK